MKIKVGTKFKAIEGLSKGKVFTVIQSDSAVVKYRSEETGEVYMIGYSDLLAHKNLKKYRDEYGDDSIGVKMIYKEID